MTTLFYIQVDTGTSTPLPKPNMPDRLIAALVPIAISGHGAINGLHFDVALLPGGWRLEVRSACARATRLATCHIGTPGADSAVWDDLVRHRRSLGRRTPALSVAGPLPWLAVSLEQAVLAMPAVGQALGLDSALCCMAWTLLEHVPPGPAAANDTHPVRQIPGSLAAAVAALAAALPQDANLQSFAARIDGAGRWSLHDEIVAQAHGIRGDDDRFHLIQASVKLPFDPLWLEFAPGAFPTRELGTSVERVGLLLTRPLPGHLRVRVAFVRSGALGTINDPIEIPPYRYERFDPTDRPEAFLAEQASFAIRLLLVLTAKRAPIVISAADHPGSPAGTRAGTCRPRLSAAQLVRWDLTPVLYADHPEQGHRGPCRLHWQRGHVKLRKNGAFYWGPHLRGRRGGEVPVGREDIITASAR
ncbi:conserved protein of unknown function [Rhodovastum atsumiense]|uniref:Uncharacterized protein n=1 Tax=Rhodovastum atsumiense TaxID=504468 RepID=A0A5M6IV38_9PROT|nr:hypothetical protein [Rhodovastum atsumiense]KAA5612132.1 hypothetical protein F1189_10720 [Rhodovastum atsumiense]CAH2603925.1 conserved protein of unknown function [Rhodovastum atsumiense]